MRNKHLVIWLVALAWITIQVHNIVPHHHHDKYAYIPCTHSCEHHQHDSSTAEHDHHHDHHDHNHEHEDGTCNFAQNEILIKQQGFIFILPTVLVEKLLVPENSEKEYHFTEPDLIYEDINSCPLGLRAPPALA